MLLLFETLLDRNRKNGVGPQDAPRPSRYAAPGDAHAEALLEVEVRAGKRHRNSSLVCVARKRFGPDGPECSLETLNWMSRYRYPFYGPQARGGGGIPAGTTPWASPDPPATSSGVSPVPGHNDGGSPASGLPAFPSQACSESRSSPITAPGERRIMLLMFDRGRYLVARRSRNDSGWLGRSLRRPRTHSPTAPLGLRPPGGVEDSAPATLTRNQRPQLDNSRSATRNRGRTM
jgi:hypothetical protein